MQLRSSMNKLQICRKILQAYPELLLQENQKYSAEKIMMVIERKNLKKLEEKFKDDPNGIDLQQYVPVMLSSITHPTEEKYDLVAGLIQLFDEVDINGDGRLDWGEFSQYIIDSVLGQKETKFFDVGQEKERDFSEQEILDRAYERKSKVFNLIQRDILKQDHLIQLIIRIIYKKQYFLKNQNFLQQKGQQDLRLYNPKPKQEIIFQKELKLPLQETSSEKVFIQGFGLNDDKGILATVNTDKLLQIWSLFNLKRVSCVKKYQSDVFLTDVWFLKMHKQWLVATRNNHIIYFNEDEDQLKPIQISKDSNKHKKLITGCEELQSLKLLATCSLDGYIKLWDIYDRSLLCELRDNNLNFRGVKGVTYTYEFGQSLLSYGFQGHINIWCPETSLTRPYLGKLDCNCIQVVCCQFIPSSPNLISIDDQCNIRVWDIRTHKAIQVIIPDDPVQVYSLSIANGFDTMIVGGKRLMYYSTEEVTNNLKNFNNDIKIVQIEYNWYFKQIIILTAIDLRIYDAISGKLKSVYNQIQDPRFPQAELTGMCFNLKQSKFYLSDSAGLIRQYNMKSGTLMHSIDKNQEQKFGEFNQKKGASKEISCMQYFGKEKLLITGSFDSTIRIYDDNDDLLITRILSGGHKDSQITCIDFSQNHWLLASGSENGIVTLWDFQLARANCVFQNHTQDINCLKFCDEYPLLISGSIDKTICVYSTLSQSTQKLQCLKIFEVEAYIQNIMYENDKIFLSDIQGNLSITSVDTLQINIQPIKFQKFFNFRKNQFFDAEKQVRYFIEQQNQLKLLLAPQKIIIEKQWKAHKQGIKKLSFIQDPFIIITLGMDKIAKFWSQSGQLYGLIDSTLQQQTIWKLPFDWVGIKISQLEKTLEVFSKVYQEEFSLARKEEIFFETLISRFFKNKDTFYQYFKKFLNYDQEQPEIKVQEVNFDDTIEKYKQYVRSYQKQQFQNNKIKEEKQFDNLKNKQEIDLREKALKLIQENKKQYNPETKLGNFINEKLFQKTQIKKQEILPQKKENKPNIYLQSAKIKTTQITQNKNTKSMKSFKINGEVKDVKYKQGEYKREMQIQNVRVTSSHCKFAPTSITKQKIDTNEDFKVVAKKNHMLNRNQSVDKIFKVGKKLYVL